MTASDPALASSDPTPAPKRWWQRPLALAVGPRGTFVPEPAERVAEYRAGQFSAQLTDAPPVVCIHGTIAGPECFTPIAQSLRARGRLVYSLSFGSRGTDAITANTAEIAALIHAILADTGASQVDLVGHSQGGYQAMHLLTSGSLAPTQVRRIVSISGCFRGVPHPRWLSLRLARRVAGQGFADLLTRLPWELPTAPPQSPPLLSIASRADLVVPFSSSLIDDQQWPGARTILLDGHAHHTIFAADEVVELVTAELS